MQNPHKCNAALGPEVCIYGVSLYIAYYDIRYIVKNSI